MDKDTLQQVLKDHSAWLASDGAEGKRADLSGANLSGANLYGADLREADLSGANLSGANLYGADLREADLSGANLSGANLSGANLREANLSGADLRWADLSGADLYGADLSGADLREANLSGASYDSATEWPHFQLPEGSLIVWGKKDGKLIKMKVPKSARRTACLINRKCRAEYVKVLEGEAVVETDYGTTIYKPGEIVRPHGYCDDFTQDCRPGIHFFLTKKEAEEW